MVIIGTMSQKLELFLV